jgi:hypothetical protein
LEEKMKYAQRILISILLVGFCYSALIAVERTRDIVIRVFKIPGEQSFEMKWPVGEGETADLTISGEVTANFPRGVVFLETDLAANASDTAVARIIQDKVMFGRGAFIPKAVRIDELEALKLRLDGVSSSAQSKCEEKKGEGRWDDYEVRAEWKSEGSDLPRVHIKISAGWSAGGGSMAAGFSGDVFDQSIDVSEARLQLIGFRSIDKKTVFWLGVCAVPRAK